MDADVALIRMLGGMSLSIAEIHEGFGRIENR
jgi:hypothetical protein